MTLDDFSWTDPLISNRLQSFYFHYIRAIDRKLSIHIHSIHLYINVSINLYVYTFIQIYIHPFLYLSKLLQSFDKLNQKIYFLAPSRLANYNLLSGFVDKPSDQFDIETDKINLDSIKDDSEADIFDQIDKLDVDKMNLGAKEVDLVNKMIIDTFIDKLEISFR